MEDCKDTPINDIRNVKSVKDEMIHEVLCHYYPDRTSDRSNKEITYKRHLYDLNPESFKSYMMNFYIRRLDDKTAEREEIIKKMKSL